MGTIHPFGRVRSFDPDTQIMGVALDSAWYNLMVSGSALAESWRRSTRARRSLRG
jgi:hypothetical protein